MRIVSTFFAPEEAALTGNRPTVMMAFDTLVDQKRLVVGITVGLAQGKNLSDVVASEAGQLIIERCGRHMQRNYPQGAALVAGVASVSGAKERVRKVLANAPEYSFVLLLCANGKVYDAAFPALGVDYQSANTKLQ